MVEVSHLLRLFSAIGGLFSETLATARVKAHSSRCDNLVMPVSMGILCERCRTVYFISRPGKSPHIRYDRSRGDFKLICVPPCKAVSYFHKTMLRPYSASAEAIERGYADVTECRTIGNM